jgi:hypothetical protein
LEERERNNKLMPIISKTKSVYTSGILEIKNNNLEEGMECFSQWLSIEEGNGEDNNKNVQLTLIVFEKMSNKLLLHDNLHKSDIEIIFTDGVPFCTLCRTDDCAHSGFAICAKQNL